MQRTVGQLSQGSRSLTEQNRGFRSQAIDRRLVPAPNISSHIPQAATNIETGMNLGINCTDIHGPRFHLKALKALKRWWNKGFNIGTGGVAPFFAAGRACTRLPGTQEIVQWCGAGGHAPIDAIRQNLRQGHPKNGR